MAEKQGEKTETGMSNVRVDTQHLSKLLDVAARQSLNRSNINIICGLHTTTALKYAFTAHF